MFDADRFAIEDLSTVDGDNDVTFPEQSMLAEAQVAGRLERVSIGRGVLRVETAATSLIAAARASARA